MLILQNGHICIILYIYTERETVSHISETAENQSMCHVSIRVLYEPRHDKTCLREFPTRLDTNRPAQPQQLARVLKFRLQNLEILYYLSSDNKGADQTARMRRLICAFVVRM